MRQGFREKKLWNEEHHVLISPNSLAFSWTCHLGQDGFFHLCGLKSQFLTEKLLANWRAGRRVTQTRTLHQVKALGQVATHPRIFIMNKWFCGLSSLRLLKKHLASQPRS